MSAIGKVFKKIFGFIGKIFGFRKVSKTTSHTYSDSMATLTSNTAPVPLIYGEVKSAGNRIYSRLNKDKTVTYQLIVFGDGEVEEIKDLKLNDIPADSPDLKGVSFNTYTGDGEQFIDSRVEGATNLERAKVVGSLKYDAYVAFQATANDSLSGNINVTALVKGRKVRVYTSPTTYNFEWSDNPAWCVLDFLTCYNGCGLPYEAMNIESFIDASNFYTNNKYTLNVILDETKSRLEWVNLMLACCRSYLIYQNGKYALFVEKAEQVVQSYDDTNTNNLNIWFSEVVDVPDSVVVKYVEPEQEWATIGAPATVISPGTPIRKEEMELIGVTNYNQASRLAWFYLNQAHTCKTFISFETNRRAIDRTVGDVIEYSDYVCEWIKKKFRVLSLEESQNGTIKLTCREYNEEIYNEKKGETAPVFTPTKLEDPQKTPPSILYLKNIQDYYILPDRTPVSLITIYYDFSGYSYSRSVHTWYKKVGTNKWMFGGEFLTENKFLTIKGLDIKSTYEFKFVHESIFGKRSAFTYSPEIYIEGKNIAPAVPQDFIASQAAGGVNLLWTTGQELDLDHYELYLTEYDEANKLADVKGNTFFYSYAYEIAYIASTLWKQYTFYLVAVDNVGNKSEPAVAYIDIFRPDNVTGFSCVQNERNIEFVWNKSEGAAYYEIREGDSWDTAQPLAVSAGDSFYLAYAQERYTNFWIRAYSEYRVPCEFPSFATLYVASIPNRNMIYTYDAPGNGWAGGKIFTHVNAGGLQLDDKFAVGEYSYLIELDQEYTSRNWIEKSIVSYSSKDDVIWRDAEFTWNSFKAKSMTWVPTSEDFSYMCSTQIAVNAPIPTNIKDYWELDGSLTSNTGKLPGTGVGDVSYAQSQYHKGVLMDGNSFVKWENLDIGSIFSLKLTMKLPNKNAYDYVIVMLKNDAGETMTISYSRKKNCYVLETSSKERIELADESLPGDYISFVFSQGNGYLNFLVYSAFYDKYQFSKIPYTDLKIYTQMALYADY